MAHNKRSSRVFPARIAAILIFVLIGGSLSVAQKRAATAKAVAHEPLNAKLTVLDGIMQEGIQQGALPGGVLLVSHRGRVIYRKAFGERSVLPTHEKMTVGTIFDLASLTKLFATTPSIMRLLEEGKIRLSDPLVKYMPEFAPNGKDHITIRMLLTHTSELQPDPLLLAVQAGEDALMKEIVNVKLMPPPGDRFIYSDTNFILLGELVKRITGKRLDEYAQENFYRPMHMTHTRFLPPAAWIPEIAPTEEVDLPPGAKAGSGLGHVLRGVVHDPRSRAIGGVAGHAGLFSTADDLAIFCQMMLNEGTVRADGVTRRIFSAATVHKMT